MSFFKSVFPKPDAAVVAGVAVAGSVFTVYQLAVGPVSGATASSPNHPANESARRKAGYMAFLLVSGLTLLTRDTTIATLGYGSIVAMELVYRHGIMVNPATGQMQSPNAAEYTMAGESNVYPIDDSQAS